MLSAGLSGSRINRNFPRDVLFGPISDGGIGMWNLYDYQCISHISFLTEHLNEDNISGELIRCSIEAALVEIGIGRNLFTLDFNLYKPLLTDCWIKHIWKYAHDNSITIKENITTKPYLRREHDLFLMEIFAEHGFSEKELHHINRCRLHIRAMTVTDIFDGYGNRYDKNSFNCIRNVSETSPYVWPKQPRPGPLSRRLWKKAIKTCFPRNEDNMTIYSLGRWMCDPKIDKWTWFFYPGQNYLYKRSMRGWEIFVRRARAGNLGEFPQFIYYNRAIMRPRES